MANRIKRATIYDVASQSGVSITTVSRFLNDTDSVKVSTGERIAQAMEELDYVPHGNTGSRADRSVGRVGVLTPFFPAPSFVQRLEGMIPILRENHFEVVVYTVENPEQLDEYLTSVPFTRRIDGLILMSIRLTPEQHRILSNSGLNVVMVESDDNNYSRVLADDKQGGYLAAGLFMERNYFPCVYLEDRNRDISYSLHPSDVRLEGFREALAPEGLDSQVTVLATDTVVCDAKKVFGEYLDANPAPRGVFAMSDVQAIGALKAARERGLRIPEDIAILGFDDIEAAGWMEITSISQHLGDSGRVAASLLLDRLSGRSTALQKVNLQVKLIERLTA